jgi:hypothetical protein
MLAQLERRQRRKGMRVLAGAYHHGVELLLILVKLAEIHEAFRLGKLLPGRVQCRLSHVANGDDVLAPANVAHVAATAPAGADDGDVQFAVEILAAQECRRHHRAHCGSGEQFGKMTPGQPCRQWGGR